MDEVHTLDTAHAPFVTQVAAVADILTAEVDRLAADVPADTRLIPG